MVNKINKFKLNTQVYEAIVNTDQNQHPNQEFVYTVPALGDTILINGNKKTFATHQVIYELQTLNMYDNEEFPYPKIALTRMVITEKAKHPLFGTNLNTKIYFSY